MNNIIVVKLPKYYRAKVLSCQSIIVLKYYHTSSTTIHFTNNNNTLYQTTIHFTRQQYTSSNNNTHHQITIHITNDMYSILNPTQILLEEAEKVVVENDRMLYVDYFKAIESFIAENDGVVTGNIASQLLLNKPIDRNSFMYEIYFDDAGKKANELVDKLYEIKHLFVNSKLIYSQTRLKGREIDIFVDGRKFAIIYSPTKYQQIPITKLMGDNKVPGHFNTNIRVVPVEFLLIDIYCRLYSPNPIYIREWSDLYAMESKLYNLVEKSLSKNIFQRIEGGNDDDNEVLPNKREMVAIVLEYLRDSDHILIGDHVEKFNAKTARLQLISHMPINEIVAELTTAIAAIKQIKIIFNTTGITADIRILKYTVFAWSKNQQIHICDIYNSAAVEPIPFIMGKGEHKNIKLGNLYVRARFLLIDLWAMKLIINQDRMKGEKGKEGWSTMRINELLKSYKNIKKQISEAKPSELFQYRDYVGVYEEPRTTKRKIFQGYPSYYYPAKVKK